MADEKGKVTEAQKAPRSQTKGDTPQPQTQATSSQESAFAGDNKAVLNPALQAKSASIPTGVDENGITQTETFVLGEEYNVNDDALQVKNTEEIAFLVKA